SLGVIRGAALSLASFALAVGLCAGVTFLATLAFATLALTAFTLATLAFTAFALAILAAVGIGELIAGGQLGHLEGVVGGKGRGGQGCAGQQGRAGGAQGLGGLGSHGSILVWVVGVGLVAGQLAGPRQPGAWGL